MTIGHKGCVPKDMEKKKMNTNPPSYVHIRPIIKQCQGCRVPFDTSDHTALHDLVSDMLCGGNTRTPRIQANGN